MTADPSAVGVIADVLRQHVDRQLMNYDTGREECGCGRQGDSTHTDHQAAEVDAALSAPRELPNVVVDRAAQLRFEHYTQRGTKPLPWSRLTDAQKLPWLLAASWAPEETQP